MNPQRHMELIEAFGSASSIEEIHEVCSDLCEQFGFDHFLYGARIPVSLVKPQIFIISGFPSAWWSHYKQSNYLKIDPTVAHCASRTVPLRWSSLKPEKIQNPQVKKLMQEAWDCGLRDGLSLPVHGHQGETAQLSLTCGEASGASRKRLEHALPFVQLLTNYLHEAARRIIEVRQITPARAQLTRREKECLLWTAEGKTAWEISQILGVSERTATFHLQNAAGKLNVTNRQHAVARAVSLGLITPVIG